VGASAGDAYPSPAAYVSSRDRMLTSAFRVRVGWRHTARVEGPASGVFVGRARELGRLERALDATRAGSGMTALVAGDAGIGKSRLASQLAARARKAGFEVLIGRCIDLVGTQLPYQPFVEALRPLGALVKVDERTAGSQLRAFEQTLAQLSDRAAKVPVLLVLEDLHWADTSTLDLVVFLAHYLGDRRVLVLATFRADEPASSERVGRLADAVRRSGAALVLELGPLEREELTALLAARAQGSLAATLTDAIVARSEGNPFFAEELLVAAREGGGQLPRGLRVLLLRRVAQLDPTTQGVLRLAAAAGRDVGYALLRAAAELAEHDLRESLRRAVEHGVLVAVQETGSFRFRHALLAEAIYATLLPGEREDLHGRLAERLASSAAAAPAELAPHWAAAGRTKEALIASVEAAREAEEVWGLAEALAHLERAFTLWHAVPNAAEVVETDLAELCARAAELAWNTGAAPRAVELVQQAIEWVGDGDPLRAALLHEGLGRYLHDSGRGDVALAAIERAVELAPALPPSPERAQVLAILGNGLMVAWRYDEAVAACEQALPIARTVGAGSAEVLALRALGSGLAYLGRGDEGLAQLWLALRLAEERSDPNAHHAYVSLTDVLTMLGRPRESARLAATAFEALQRYGLDQTTLVANEVEALVAIGEWDQADRVSVAALRAMTAKLPHQPLIMRASLETGRGEFDAARAHFQAAAPTLHGDPDVATYSAHLADLALWERRWADADQAVTDGLARARSRHMAQLRVWLCAEGLRAQAELAALARARRDAEGVRTWLFRAEKLITVARHAAAEASPVTPNSGGWLALAEAEYERAHHIARPQSWSQAAAAWERLERPPLVAYCRWREAEAIVATGASRREASAPLGRAHAIAARIGAKPLLLELELLAERARLELAPPGVVSSDGRQGQAENLGLTPREAEVLTLLARGYTNREIAAALVISVRTAGVHVSHILRKLGAPNRMEAAAIAHRLSPSRARQHAFDD
jgi:DNA-binding CsgD family transcriptional regulator/tetratricopeptide (TPR) repeat protein